MAASGVALGLGGPTLIAGIAIKTVDRQPAIFRNTRLGRNWQTFEVLKLATMQPDAHFYEQQWQDDNTDPRITPLGRIIRRLDLNEVPQVANVWEGDMHFVASRPVNEHVPDRLQDADAMLFDEWHSLYPLFKPGLIGPGQLAERRYARRGDLSAASCSRMLEDIKYWTKTASLGTDLRIAMQVPMEFLTHVLNRDRSADAF